MAIICHKAIPVYKPSCEMFLQELSISIIMKKRTVIYKKIELHVLTFYYVPETILRSTSTICELLIISSSYEMNNFSSIL